MDLAPIVAGNEPDPDSCAIAHFDGGIGASQIRWNHLEHGEPGRLTNAASAAAAEDEIRAWVAGLDIVPWD